ncbi:unnamed protein product, partial [Pylaiella littoralis]
QHHNTEQHTFLPHFLPQHHTTTYNMAPITASIAPLAALFMGSTTTAFVAPTGRGVSWSLAGPQEPSGRPLPPSPGATTSLVAGRQHERLLCEW